MFNTYNLHSNKLISTNGYKESYENIYKEDHFKENSYKGHYNVSYNDYCKEFNNYISKEELKIDSYLNKYKLAEDLIFFTFLFINLFITFILIYRRFF